MISFEPGNPTTVPCSRFQAPTFATSRPSALKMPPVESLTAMTVEPSSTMSSAAMRPALP